MWSSNNQRIKALMAVRQRAKERLTRPIHVLRADVDLFVCADEPAPPVLPETLATVTALPTAAAAATETTPTETPATTAEASAPAPAENTVAVPAGPAGSACATLIHMPARALLNDFTENGIALYTAQSLPPNMELVLKLQHPHTLEVRCRVIWCQFQTTSSHVIKPDSFSYRVGLAFHVPTPEKAAEIKKFCQEMSGIYVPDLVAASANTAAPATTPTEGEAPAADATPAPDNVTALPTAEAAAEAPVEEQKAA